MPLITDGPRLEVLHGMPRDPVHLYHIPADMGKRIPDYEPESDSHQSARSMLKRHDMYGRPDLGALPRLATGRSGFPFRSAATANDSC